MAYDEGVAERVREIVLDIETVEEKKSRGEVKTGLAEKLEKVLLQQMWEHHENMQKEVTAFADDLFPPTLVETVKTYEKMKDGN